MARFSTELIGTARIRAAPSLERRVADDPSRGVFVRHAGAVHDGFLISAAADRFLTSIKQPAVPDSRGLRGRSIARLILDGLVELEWRGRFRSGPRLHRAFFRAEPRSAGAHPIARLSAAALRYGAALGPIDVGELVGRLYRYHGEPVSPAMCIRFPDDTAVEQFIGGRADLRRRRLSTNSRLRDRSYAVWASATRDDWKPRRAQEHAITWKLYLSPTIDGMPEVWAALRDRCAHGRGPFAIKTARVLSALLRPDRMVAYFTNQDDLRESALWLRRRLTGMPAHGVPFTASFGRDGLLSWGVDFAPYPEFDERYSGGGRSWRAWIASRLATALAAGVEAGLREPDQYAMDRVSLDGVAVDRWRPTAELLRSVISRSDAHVAA